MSVPWPGKMKLANERGSYQGVDIKEFRAPNIDVQIREFFAQPGFERMLQIQSQSCDAYTLVWYSMVLTPEEHQEIEEYGREIDLFLTERRQKRAEAQAKEQEALAQREAESARLREVGRKCEANHGAIVKQLRDDKKGKKGKKELPEGTPQ